MPFSHSASFWTAQSIDRLFGRRPLSLFFVLSHLLSFSFLSGCCACFFGATFILNVAFQHFSWNAVHFLLETLFPSFLIVLMKHTGPSDIMMVLRWSSCAPLLNALFVSSAFFVSLTHHFVYFLSLLQSFNFFTIVTCIWFVCSQSCPLLKCCFVQFE